MYTRHQSGWTLLESLIVLAVMSILVTLALPYWKDTIGRFRIQSAVNQLTSGIAHSRSESIRRASSVVIQRRDDCVHRDWSCGWFSFEDDNGNLLFDKEESVIRTFEPTTGVLVSTNATGLRQRMRLTPRGTSHGVSAGSFFFRQDQGAQCTRLIFSAGLRWRTEVC